MTSNRITEQFTGVSVSQLQSFNNIIKICDENNIKVYLIKFPLSNLYLEERKKNQHYLNLITPNINDLSLFDFSHSIQELKFYEDQDHLNLLGKQEFVKLLNNKLRFKH